MNNKYKTTEIYIKNRVITVNISNHFQQRFIERIGYLDLNTIINNSWFYNPKTDVLPKNVSSEIFHRTKKRGDFMYLINDDYRTLIVIGKYHKWKYYNVSPLILVTIISLNNYTFYDDELDFNFDDNYLQQSKIIKMKVGGKYYSVAA